MNTALRVPLGDKRLIFSIALKKRDAWHIKVILRWFRILGLKIEAFYCDFWLAYPPAINAIYPKAEIQFDFFHVMQNIHRHLYKDFTTYRKLFKNSNDDKELEKAHKKLHKQLPHASVRMEESLFTLHK